MQWTPTWLEWLIGLNYEVLINGYDYICNKVLYIILGLEF